AEIHQAIILKCTDCLAETGKKHRAAVTHQMRGCGAESAFGTCSQGSIWGDGCRTQIGVRPGERLSSRCNRKAAFTRDRSSKGISRRSQIERLITKYHFPVAGEGLDIRTIGLNCGNIQGSRGAHFNTAGRGQGAIADPLFCRGYTRTTTIDLGRAYRDVVVPKCKRSSLDHRWPCETVAGLPKV